MYLDIAIMRFDLSLTNDADGDDIRGSKEDFYRVFREKEPTEDTRTVRNSGRDLY